MTSPPPWPRPSGAAGARPRRGDRGASALELALYLPLLFLIIFVVVQFALMFFADQAAAAAAREAARVARAGCGTAQALRSARERGAQYASTVGKGVLLDPQVLVQRVNPLEVRVVVDAAGLQVVPGLPAPRIHQVVQGPLESFRPDQ